MLKEKPGRVLGLLIFLYFGSCRSLRSFGGSAFRFAPDLDADHQGDPCSDDDVARESDEYDKDEHQHNPEERGDTCFIMRSAVLYLAKLKYTDSPLRSEGLG
jgi:hypothetical protein